MPETLKQVVDRVKAAKTAIGNAIVAKGGTVGANDGLEEYPADIATIPTGGITPAEPKDVNFYDYDGTCLYSYTADEFAELSAMPANPSHSGLTAQGWNWSLADAKEYVAKYDSLIIGQMYVTSDGKTRIYINLSDGAKAPYLQLYLYANSEIEVDWGDESSITTYTSSSAGIVTHQHTYSTAGKYVISITTISGSFGLNKSTYSFLNGNGVGDSIYTRTVERIEIGNGITTLGSYALQNFSCIECITLPQSINAFGTYCFQNCFRLKSLIVPDGVTNLNNSFIEQCYSFLTISLPKSVKTEERYTFALTYIRNIAIGNITQVPNNCLSSCSMLSSVVLSSSLRSIGVEAFRYCVSLYFVKFTATTPPVISNINAWNSVQSGCYILVPLNTLDDYLNTTNMPDDSVYMYLCYAKYADGVTLPTTSEDGYSLTWYASKDDARAGTNPITVGNNKEIFAVGV